MAVWTLTILDFSMLRTLLVISLRCVSRVLCRVLIPLRRRLRIRCVTRPRALSNLLIVV